MRAVMLDINKVVPRASSEMAASYNGSHVHRCVRPMGIAGGLTDGRGHGQSYDWKQPNEDRSQNSDSLKGM